MEHKSPITKEDLDKILDKAQEAINKSVQNVKDMNQKSLKECFSRKNK